MPVILEQTWSKPVDMERIPSPVIGYTGAILESRLNSALVYEITRQLPQFSFVFVGPEDEHFRQHVYGIDAPGPVNTVFDTESWV